MKVLGTLLVLIPILAVAAMLAGILEFDRWFGVCGLAFMVNLFAAWLWALCLLFRELAKRFGTPVGWCEAQTLYPVPEISTGPRIPDLHLVKESGRGRCFPCKLRLGNDGVLIKHDSPVPLYY